MDKQLKTGFVSEKDKEYYVLQQTHYGISRTNNISMVSLLTKNPKTTTWYVAAYHVSVTPRTEKTCGATTKQILHK